jgi:hypothetical protein
MAARSLTDVFGRNARVFGDYTEVMHMDRAKFHIHVRFPADYEKQEDTLKRVFDKPKHTEFDYFESKFK